MAKVGKRGVSYNIHPIIFSRFYPIIFTGVGDIV